MHLDKLNPTMTQAKPAIEEDYLHEPTKEEIMEDIRQGLRDVLVGYAGQDALEFLDELEREAMVNADES